MRVKLIGCYFGDNSNEDDEKVEKKEKNGSSLNVSILFEMDSGREKESQSHKNIYVVRKGKVVLKAEGDFSKGSLSRRNRRKEEMIIIRQEKQKLRFNFCSWCIFSHFDNYFIAKRLMKNNKLEKYGKIDKLGEGTYGVVYKVVNYETNEHLALKKIRLESDEEGIPSTALRQISILKELNHPNIVKLLDIIHSNRKLVLIFEYVEYDLKKYMSKFKQNGMDPKTVKSFCYQLLNGVQHCHEKKILHRDLKPQNLLISNQQQLKIADFGLARVTGIPTKGYTHQVVTLWYRPPDILLGSQKYCDTIDLWSVGCILAEMVNMRPLFPGQKEEDELNRIFEILGTPNSQSWPGVEELPHWENYQFKEYKKQDLRKIVPKLDELGIDLLEKMLEPNPNKRINAKEALKHKYFDELRGSN